MSEGGSREVRLIGFPLDVYQRSVEGFEGLRREFVLVAMRSPEAQDTPARLLRLVEALTEEFQDVGVDANTLRDAAIGRGETAVDLVYRMPVAAGVTEACVSLSGMMDEADEFCRRGEHLLSLASPTEAVAFRRWYLGEVVAQLGGEAPLAWPDADHDALVREPRLRGTAPAPAG